MLPDRLGDGMTAGNGMDGLGDCDLCRIDWLMCEPNEDLRLCVVGGGFIETASDCGVPGAEGFGEPTDSDMAS
jgi:hypothetical protein